MIQIAICEDIREDALVLKDALNRYLNLNRIPAEIKRFENGEKFLSSFAPGKYQIIFMDIGLKKDGITGMEAAKKVYASDKDAAVVLVTVSTDYVLDGYSCAEYYIVKPVSDEQIAEAMKKCRAQIERFTKTIGIVVEGQPVEIRIRDILLVKASRFDCVIITPDGELTASNMKISNLSKKLSGLPFVQCHRSFIVNLLYVKSMQGNEFTMENGKSVPIGRTEKANTLKAFKTCFLNRLQGKGH